MVEGLLKFSLAKFKRFFTGIFLKRGVFLGDREWNPLFRRTVLIVFLHTFVPDDWRSFYSLERVSRGFFCTFRTKFLAKRSEIFVGRAERGRPLVRLKDFHLRTVSPTVEIGIFNTDEIFLYPEPSLCRWIIDFLVDSDNSAALGIVGERKILATR